MVLRKSDSPSPVPEESHGEWTARMIKEDAARKAKEVKAADQAKKRAAKEPHSEWTARMIKEDAARKAKAEKKAEAVKAKAKYDAAKAKVDEYLTKHKKDDEIELILSDDEMTVIPDITLPPLPDQKEEVSTQPGTESEIQAIDDQRQVIASYGNTKMQAEAAQEYISTHTQPTQVSPKNNGFFAKLGLRMAMLGSLLGASGTGNQEVRANLNDRPTRNEAVDFLLDEQNEAALKAAIIELDTITINIDNSTKDRQNAEQAKMALTVIRDVAESVLEFDGIQKQLAESEVKIKAVTEESASKPARTNIAKQERKILDAINDSIQRVFHGDETLSQQEEQEIASQTIKMEGMVITISNKKTRTEADSQHLNAMEAIRDAQNNLFGYSDLQQYLVTAPAELTVAEDIITQTTDKKAAKTAEKALNVVKYNVDNLMKWSSEKEARTTKTTDPVVEEIKNARERVFSDAGETPIAERPTPEKPTEESTPQAKKQAEESQSTIRDTVAGILDDSDRPSVQESVKARKLAAESLKLIATAADIVEQLQTEFGVKVKRDGTLPTNMFGTTGKNGKIIAAFEQGQDERSKQFQFIYGQLIEIDTKFKNQINNHVSAEEMRTRVNTSM